ncbi:MAG: SCO family protein [Alphaproteobacteria bacterium]|nr:SCO family protein [Alphaproteobacteria bacterium]
MFRALAVAAACATAFSAAGAPVDGNGRLDERAALSVSAAAVGRALADNEFVDHHGRTVTLAALRGRPLILPLIYTGCYHTCPLIAQSLLHAVAVARQALPRDSFQVAVVGFEAGVDTPERMHAFAKSQGLDQPGWTFLSGSAAAIDSLARDVGFTFVRSPRGFDHVAQTTIVDAQGQVYWQVYGSDFKSSAVVEPLKQLVYGRPARFTEPSTWWDRLRLLCTVYDPTQDRYRFSYAIFVGALAGLVSLAGTGWVLVRNWLRLRAQQA